DNIYLVSFLYVSLQKNLELHSEGVLLRDIETIIQHSRKNNGSYRKEKRIRENFNYCSIFRTQRTILRFAVFISCWLYFNYKVLDLFYRHKKPPLYFRK